MERPAALRVLEAARALALPVLATLALLEGVRALVPFMDPVFRAFALRRSFNDPPNPAEVAAFVVGFGLILLAAALAPSLAARLRGRLALAGVILAAAAARAALSLAPDGIAQFRYAALVVALLVLAVPALMARAARDGRPARVAFALLVALLLDLGVRAAGATRDLTLAPDAPGAGVAVAAALALAALAAPAPPAGAWPPPERREGASLARGLLAGGALFLATHVVASPASFARWTGVSTALAFALAFAGVAAGGALALVVPLSRAARAALGAPPLLFALALLAPGAPVALRAALGALAAASVSFALARALEGEARAASGRGRLFPAAALVVFSALAWAYIRPFARSPTFRLWDDVALAGALALAGVVVAACLALLRDDARGVRARRWPRALALAALALATAVAAPLAAPAAPAPEPPEPGAPFTFVTYNVHQGVSMRGMIDWRGIVEVLRPYDAAIIAVQEAETGRAARGEVDGLAFLARELGMSVVFAPTIGREYGNAVLSRYPVVEGETVLLPSAAEQRGAARARVDLGDGRLVDVYATHLGFSSREREAQTGAIARRVSEAGVPAFVAGDFNDFGGSATLPLSAIGMHRSQDILAGPPPVTFTTRSPRIAIDYVYATRDFRFTDHDVDPNRVASDHFMVAARVAWV